MRIGIMGAMIEEIDSIYPHIINLEVFEHGNRRYYLGQISSYEVVLVFSRWGKVAAATTATSLITEFKVNQLIFTGVAGAIDPHLNIGDIIISDQLYQHDMDARPLFQKHQIPLTDIKFFKANTTLKEKAFQASSNLFTSLSKKISASSLARFSIVDPKCYLGTIATGDQFVYNTECAQLILGENPEACAVEMEGAAVAQVCHDYKVPFVVIRTISDKADHSSEIDFPLFVKEIARHYSEHIVMSMLNM